ncbi:YjaG family protein [Paraferrimonas haliotis]|uniref:DUF416 family protein n=1 Tax=Paraferrimonas haliotis TaxID=2013866 RepID=A0AA37WXQ8_9GAMM|nr:YjaG family protein [Paraferrimonas haliotis]GLS82835.1 hypothetical protein GCM10007894_08120 [Paraferrimonas haliotis]
MANVAGFFQRVKDLSFSQKQLFAIALCQRMQPNFNFFWREKGGELSEKAQKQFDITLGLLWQKLYDRKLKVNYEVHIERLEAVTPDIDNEDLYAARPAMDACVTLVVILNALETKNDEELINVSRISNSTVITYLEAFDDNELSGEALTKHIMSHPMLNDEKQLQASLLEWAEQANPADAEQTKALRAELVATPVSNLGIEL